MFDVSMYFFENLQSNMNDKVSPHLHVMWNLRQLLKFSSFLLFI